jgi:uncharacterized membrane protein YkoI
MRNAGRSAAAALLLVAGLATGAAAQGGGVTIKEDKPGLLKLARITPDSATKLAQARFPNGVIKSGEIEREDGKLIYSFDIQLPGVTGIEEVNIDAMTGAVKTEHENPAPAKPEKPAPKPPVKKPPAR